ncbi:hypothetical protein [Actinacidiphila sp. ITFR-21]|uniref:hypothetical protein n=1 Tax=Actinacidiphila sp. ITFR-21 TaxID=3075199 RepID=UPI00288A235F|nr:hypothetical protein [Streptomyces sp. ITFR-21]WNI14509.1 hypothetical protein RLT57_02440 [Streptomyces sp. ITFR-21]
MNSCPTCWARDMAATARSTQFAAGSVEPDPEAVGTGGTGVAPPDAEAEGDGAAVSEAVVVEPVVVGVPPAVADEEGAAGVEVADVVPPPLPQAATATSTPRATAQSTGRRAAARAAAGPESAAAGAVRGVLGSGGMLGWRTAGPHTS